MKRPILFIIFIVFLTAISALQKPLDSIADFDGIDGIIGKGSEILIFEDLDLINIWDQTENIGDLREQIDLPGRVITNPNHNRLFPGIILTTFFVETGTETYLYSLLNGSLEKGNSFIITNTPTSSPVCMYMDNSFYYLFGSVEGAVVQVNSSGIVSNASQGTDPVYVREYDINSHRITISLGQMVSIKEVDLSDGTYTDIRGISLDAKIIYLSDLFINSNGDHIYCALDELNQIWKITDDGIALSKILVMQDASAIVISDIEGNDSKIIAYDLNGNAFTIHNDEFVKVDAAHYISGRIGSNRIIRNDCLSSGYSGFSYFNADLGQTIYWGKNNHSVKQPAAEAINASFVFTEEVFLSENPLVDITGSFDAANYPVFVTAFIYNDDLIFPVDTSTSGFQTFNIASVESTIYSADISELDPGDYNVVLKLMDSQGFTEVYEQPLSVELHRNFYASIDECGEYFSPGVQDGCNDVLPVSYSMGCGEEALAQARIVIQDSSGSLVYEELLLLVSGTAQTFVWDGLLASDESADNGKYFIFIELVDDLGGVVSSNTEEFFINNFDYHYSISNSVILQDEGNFNIAPVWTSDNFHFYFLRSPILGCYGDSLFKTSSISGDAQVWLCDTSGSSDLALDNIVDPNYPVSINPNQYFTAAPTPSPVDILSFAFIREFNLYYLDQGSMVHVADDISVDNYCWSPDGSNLLYCSTALGINYHNDAGEFSILPPGQFWGYHKPVWALDNNIFFIANNRLHKINIGIGAMETVVLSKNDEVVFDYVHANNSSQIVYLSRDYSSGTQIEFFTILDYSLPEESWMISRFQADLSNLEGMLTISQDNSKLFYYRSTTEFQGMDCNIIGIDPYVGAESIEVFYIDLVTGSQMPAFQYTSPLKGGTPAISRDTTKILYSSYGYASSALKIADISPVSFCLGVDTTPPFVDISVAPSTTFNPVSNGSDILSNPLETLSFLSEPLIEEESGQIEVLCRSFDNQEIDRIELYLDDELLGINGGPIIRKTVDTRIYSDGEHRFKSVSRDMHGNTGSREKTVIFKNHTITTDTEAPKSEIQFTPVSFINGEIETIPAASIILTAKDNADLDPLLYYRITNSDGDVLPETLYLEEIDTYQFGVGDYTINFWSVDSSENVESEQSCIFRLVDPLELNRYSLNINTPLIFYNRKLRKDSNELETFETNLSLFSDFDFFITSDYNEFTDRLADERYGSFVVLGDEKVVDDIYWNIMQDRIFRGANYISFHYLKSRELNSISNLFNLKFEGYLPGNEYLLNISAPDFFEVERIIEIYEVMKIANLSDDNSIISSVRHKDQGFSAILLSNHGEGKLIFNTFFSGAVDLAELLSDELSYLLVSDTEGLTKRLILNKLFLNFEMDVKLLISHDGDLKFLKNSVNQDIDLDSRELEIYLDSMSDEFYLDFEVIEYPCRLEYEVLYKVSGKWYRFTREEIVFNMPEILEEGE
ncbi:hypothetical protein KAU32_06085 [bacterium]|nr:hypothetical protein [bacterium]